MDDDIMGLYLDVAIIKPNTAYKGNRLRDTVFDAR